MLSAEEYRENIYLANKLFDSHKTSNRKVIEYYTTGSDLSFTEFCLKKGRPPEKSQGTEPFLEDESPPEEWEEMDGLWFSFFKEDRKNFFEKNYQKI